MIYIYEELIISLFTFRRIVLRPRFEGEGSLRKASLSKEKQHTNSTISNNNSNNNNASGLDSEALKKALAMKMKGYIKDVRGLESVEDSDTVSESTATTGDPIII